MHRYISEMHPTSSGVYFLAAVIFAIMFSHPVSLGISFISAVISIWYFFGWDKLKRISRLIIRIMILSLIITPLLLHKGVTIITYLPWGNPLTLEACYYGVATAFSISSVILWMLFYAEVMTTDKLVYFFGKAAPSVSMVLCIILRLVPNLIEKFRQVYAYQKLNYTSKGLRGVVERIRGLVAVVSIVISWALDSGAQTAQSIKGRGYGEAKRTSFYRYRFAGRDCLFFITAVLLALFVSVSAYLGAMKWSYYYPSRVNVITAHKLVALAALLIFNMLPVIFDLSEVRIWKRSN